ncbi:MAG TPA: hypothetical protein VI341_12740 [Actinomycetota bacterium]
MGTETAGGLPSDERFAVVAVFQTDEQAQLGFTSLIDAGTRADRISIIGAGEADADEAFTGSASSTAEGAGRGAVFGGIAGAVVAIAIPGAGLILAGGLVAGAAVAGAGLGIITELGVPQANVADYEEDLTDGRYLVVVHGAPDDVRSAHAVLDMTDTEELHLYV